MSDSESGIRRSRVILLGLVLIAPMFGAGTLNIILICVASLTAYDGLYRSTVYGITTTIIGIELIYGMDVGVLSVSYVIAVCVLILIARGIALVPWTTVRGWRVGDAVRTGVIAYGLVALMSACTVLTGRVLYGYEGIADRLSIIFMSGWGVLMPVGIALMLIILRRIDEPFRRHITFGI